MRARMAVAMIAAGLAACSQPEQASESNGSVPTAAEEAPAELSMLTGVWQRSGGALTPAQLTEYGKSKSAGTGVFDDPTTRCEGFSIPRSTISEFGVTKIEYAEDHIVISYEGEGERRIPLDGRTAGGSETIAGQSIARVRNGAIEIESRNFGQEGTNWMLAPGIEGAGIVYPLSEEFTLFERYTPIDENTLDFVMVMNDPKITVWPRVFHTRWTRIANEDFIPGECVLPEQPFAADGAGAEIQQ